jgi:hypothetical protein
MAKQVGPLFFTGTVDGIIFYELNGKYYIRSKGSYKSAKHMRRNPKYKRTMENADQFGIASKMTREVYYQFVPKAARKHGVYGKLSGLATTLLHEGKNIDEARALLVAHCQSLYNHTNQQPTINKQQNAEQPPTYNVQRAATNTQPKQARYLSKWKVKPNGRLHIPKEMVTHLTVKDNAHPIDSYCMPTLINAVESIQLE